MKKVLLTAALAVATMAASAQTLYLSTYNGTNIAKFDGLTKDISMTRAVFHGWNTISLPFSLTEAQVCEYFGEDCRLEMFVGVETNANGTTMLFQDVKEQGMQANVPYILYYNGENTSVKMNMAQVLLSNAPATISYTDMNGMTITMSAAQFSVDSDQKYGILAKDNDEASFVNVADLKTKFYATHCYVQVSNFDEAVSTNLVLATRHLAASAETTAINAIVSSPNELIDVYNEAGQQVAKGMKASQFNTLDKGLYIVKGLKVRR